MSPHTLPGPLTRAEALQILRDQMSRDDLARIEATPDGEAMLAAFVDPFVELSRKLDRSITARHLIARPSDVNPPAGGAAKASASIAFRRTVVGRAIVLPARSVACRVITEEGHRYELTAAITFEPGHAGPKTVDVEAIVAGYASTVIAGRIVGFEEVAHGASGDRCSVTIVGGKTYLSRTTSGDRFYAEMVGLYLEFLEGTNAGRFARIVAIVDSVDGAKIEIEGDGIVAETTTATWLAREWGELGITVTQAADSTQGTDDELHAIARERGRQPQLAESDASIRAGILSLTDTVSPAALLRLANRALGEYGPALLYEAGTSENVCDELAGDRAFPGLVWGLTPLGIAPDGVASPVSEAGAPPAGLALLATSPRLFLIRWDGAGLDDPGAAWKADPGIAEDDEVPMGFAWGVSPLGGYPIGDAAIRQAITVGLNKIRGAGVAWTWYPQRWA